jgi:hypothetical protein
MIKHIAWFILAILILFMFDINVYFLKNYRKYFRRDYEKENFCNLYFICFYFNY